jgi:type IV secretory pathway VirB2 component (pilin)
MWDNVRTLICGAPLHAQEDPQHGERGMTGAPPYVRSRPRWILFGVFFTLMFLRVPIAFALGLACLPILLIEPRLDSMQLVQETFNAYNSFILLAVPFFLLAANLMNAGGITDRLVRFSRSLVGHFPGGLAQVNVVLSIFFAGISGSSTADAASQSKIFIDAQTKEGYDLSFSVAITGRLGRSGGHHPALDPDDRLGRRADHPRSARCSSPASSPGC